MKITHYEDVKDKATLVEIENRLRDTIDQWEKETGLRLHEVAIQGPLTSEREMKCAVARTIGRPKIRWNPENLGMWNNFRGYGQTDERIIKEESK